MDKNKLCQMAKEMMNSAYAPYSGYTVGAALLCKNGKIYTGCNIENSAHTPTCCAERTAFFKAVSEGERDFVAIAVAGGYKGKVEGIFPPCGVCRQVMSEFCDPDFKILMATPNAFEEITLENLLPYSFGLGE